MEVGRDMDADSLDDNESTRTIDSIEDSSHRRNDLMTRISDLHGQNQSLVSDYKTLSDENLELKMHHPATHPQFEKFHLLCCS
jgi:predicted transposase YbfD/YdcC